jgi:hypothetical protein
MDLGSSVERRWRRPPIESKSLTRNRLDQATSDLRPPEIAEPQATSNKPQACHNRVVQLQVNRKEKMKRKIDNNDLIPWFTDDHDTLPKSYLESCQRFFIELDRRAASRKRQATSLTQLESIRNYES